MNNQKADPNASFPDEPVDDTDPFDQAIADIEKIETVKHDWQMDGPHDTD
jgi:hypothetical protein